MSRGDVITIHVAGVPRPQPRPRWIEGRKKPVSIADKKARAWIRAIEAECLKIPRMEWMLGACRVRCYLYFPTDRAERWGRPHTTRPDADNVAKLILDSMERAGLLPKSDSRVASLMTEKRWARSGGAVIELRPWFDCEETQPQPVLPAHIPSDQAEN